MSERQARKEKIGDTEDTDSRKAKVAMPAKAEAKLIQKQQGSQVERLS